MPVLVRSLVEGDWRSIIEADNEGSSLDCLEGCLVGWIRLDKSLAHVGPVVTILRGQDTDSWALLGTLVDPSELLLELGACQLFSSDFVWELEKLILPDDEDVRVLLVVVFLWVVGWLCRNTAAVMRRWSVRLS